MILQGFTRLSSNNRGRLRNDFYVDYKKGVVMKYKAILKVTFAMIPEELVINYKT